VYEREREREKERYIGRERERRGDEYECSPTDTQTRR
jgi:hypothetical protein